jgi:hypothetical protein
MKMRSRTLKVSVVLLVAAAAVIGILAFLFQSFWFPGFTARQSAEILVRDYKFGMRALSRGKSYGDKIFPALKEASVDYSKLNQRNSFWIGELLASNPSVTSIQIALDLYGRTNDFQRLAGAIGLAAHGKLPEPVSEGAYLVKMAESTIEERGNAIPELAIIALGKTRDTNAMPVLRKLLSRPGGYWIHAYACQALQEIGDPSAVPILRGCLTNQAFYALPDAFIALVWLGDRESVPLAIRRVDPADRAMNSGYIVKDLGKVTGQDFGYDQAAWDRWWKSVERDWQIPAWVLKMKQNGRSGP